MMCRFHINMLIDLIPYGKLTWQWKMNLLNMYSLLKMGMFHSYVSLPEGG